MTSHHGTHNDLHNDQGGLPAEHPGRAKNPIIKVLDLAWLELVKPDLDASEIAYHAARQAYQEAGRRVLDATIGGKLNVFSKVDYDALF